MARMRMPKTDVTNVGNEPGAGPLRAGGQPGDIPVKDDNNLPSKPCAAAARQAGPLQLVRDVIAGDDAVKAGGTAYLPKAPGEAPDNYSARLERSVFYEATGQTLEGMVGMIFRRDPVLGDDVPEVIKEDWENIDNAGTHGAVFARQLETDAIGAGLAAFLVDYPNTGGNQTAAEDTGPQAEIRPYWVPIKKEQIVSWRTTQEAGQRILTQVVIREDVLEPAGDYGEAEVTRYRVFTRDATGVHVHVYVVTEDKRVVELPDLAGEYPTQDEIPIVEVTTSGARDLFDADPPLEGLAHLNIAHYQMDSDYRYSIHMTCVPLFVVVGANDVTGPDGQPADGKLVLGPNSALSLPTGGAAMYVSHDGAALGSVRTALQDMKADMAVMGLQQLAPDSRAAETAQAKKIDKAATDSALAVDARALQDALERGLYFHARYRGLEDGGQIEVNRDFDQLTMDAQQIQALSTMVQNGQLTLETLWTMLAEGNVLPSDFDADEEAAKLAADEQIRQDQANEEAARRLELARTQVERNPARTPPGGQGQQEGPPEEMQQAA